MRSFSPQMTGEDVDPVDTVDAVDKVDAVDSVAIMERVD